VYQVLEGVREEPRESYEGLYSVSTWPFPRLLKNIYAPQSFFKEAILWKRLKHPNVVPFIGVVTKRLQFLSEYMPHGTLTEYVGRNLGADRIGLASLSSISTG